MIICSTSIHSLKIQTSWYVHLFFHTWLLLYPIYACVTLRYIMTHSGIWINFQSTFSIAACFRLLVFCSSFLLFYSSFFVYFFASPDQGTIWKFTLCCDFQLVHQSLRNIVIHFLSVEPLFLYCDCIADLYGLQMRLDYLCDYFSYVSIKWKLSL